MIRSLITLPAVVADYTVVLAVVRTVAGASAERGIYIAVMKLLVMVFAVGLAACSNETSSSQTASQPAAALPAGMTRVADASQVCMVNDQFMGKPQIPVEVAGRTYYGCCAMCKDKLNQQPAARTARDPVTGEPVDKSTAVIIQDARGKVMYFASEHTLRRYRG